MQADCAEDLTIREAVFMVAMQRRRLAKLEALLVPQGEPKIFRVVVSAMARPLNLATSECKRTLCSDGTISEFVFLDGDRESISQAELDRFVAGFPVQA
jgi:hypothetical protein